MSLIFFFFTEGVVIRSYRKIFLPGTVKVQEKHILLLHNLCTSEMTYAVPVLS